MNGVLSAANKCGANIKDDDKTRLYGFKALDHGDFADDDLYNNISQQKHMELGFLHDDQIQSGVTHKLSQLPITQIHFTNEECNKCGIKGDRRFVYAPCHAKSQWYHPQSIMAYHPQGGRNVHPRPQLYHPQGWRDTRTGDMFGAIFTVGIHTAVRDGMGKLCGYYPCCGTQNDTGCSYRCCDRKNGSGGCEWGYYCCDGPSSAKGCALKYPCCNAKKYGKGCVKRCSNSACYKDWGTGPGCIETQWYHPQSIMAYHPQGGRNVHPRPQLYHPEGWKDTSNTDIVAGTFSLGIHTAVRGGQGKLGGYYPCCGSQNDTGCSYRCCDKKKDKSGCEW
eukprot:CAMPEP_0201594804 /NCGR_PEP_ID=MMETSP0190_2-20130828/192004_1 /ASSEMBLY_ACC=CAM_ASM_000263 /TAXON_ID=37353 /ORGANISM="Rosalina sp." /LENGTH=334 /DNA_ID=CAMNT_0048054551 /DNA_START=1176 /DNA_END=2177 /DNA_ORIENTATION=-